MKRTESERPQLKSGQNADGTFGVGNPFGKIKKHRVKGRQAALNALDDILSREGNLFRLRKALERRFRQDPVAFFERYVIPLLPRTAQLVSSSPGSQEGAAAFFQVTVLPEADARLALPAVDGETGCVEPDSDDGSGSSDA